MTFFGRFHLSKIMRGLFVVALLCFPLISVPLRVTPVHADGADSPTGRNPKLVWTRQQQAIWNRMVSENNTWWGYIKNAALAEGTASQHYSDNGAFGALAYQMTGDSQYAQKAWALIKPVMSQTGTFSDPNGLRADFTEYVRMYDWLYPSLTPDQRNTYITGLNRWADYCLGINQPAYNGGIRVSDYDQAIGEYFGLAFMDLATGPENPRAGTFLNATTQNNYIIKVGGLDATAADFSTVRNSIAAFIKYNGGSGYGSTEYNYSTDPALLIGYMGTLTATGVDHFPEITAMLPKLGQQMIMEMAPDGNTKYTWGDTEHGHSLWVQTMQKYVSLLAGLLKDDPTGPYLQQLNAQLIAWPGEYAAGAKPYPQAFLNFNPYAPAASWSNALTSYYDQAMGLTYLHQGWGAQDSFFGAQFPTPVYDDHDAFYLGDFQLFRKGEWVLTHPLSYGGSSVQGEGANAMLIAGLSSMGNNRGPIAQEFGPDNTYDYISGSTSGQYYAPGFYQPPPSFLDEWTRSMLYLPSSDKHSDTVVVFDRVNAKDPKTLTWFSHYQAADQSRINNASALKQWIIHTPVNPTTKAVGISWTTSAGQQAQVSTLLPANPRISVLNEKTMYAQGSYGGSADQGELHYQARIAPPTDQQWDTLLNVVQVSDAGTSLSNQLITSTNGNVQGALIHRSGLNDTVVMFGAQQDSRIISAGYTFALTSTATTTDLILPDLDPTKSWQLQVDGADQPLTVSAQGVAHASLTGSGSHTVQVAPTGTLAPQAIISLTKVVDKTAAAPGDTLTYSISYHNNGTGSASNTVITDLIPANTTYVVGSASDNGTLTGGSLTWNIGNLAKGGTGSVSFRVTVN